MVFLTYPDGSKNIQLGSYVFDLSIAGITIMADSHILGPATLSFIERPVV